MGRRVTRASEGKPSAPTRLSPAACPDEQETGETARLRLLVDELRSELARTKDERDALEGDRVELQQFVESMPQIVWRTRPDGWNTYFNHQWMDFTGLTLEESFGHGWNTPFHPGDQAYAAALW